MEEGFKQAGKGESNIFDKLDEVVRDNRPDNDFSVRQHWWFGDLSSVLHSLSLALPVIIIITPSIASIVTSNQSIVGEGCPFTPFVIKIVLLTNSMWRVTTTTRIGECVTRHTWLNVCYCVSFSFPCRHPVLLPIELLLLLVLSPKTATNAKWSNEQIQLVSRLSQE